MNVDREAEQTAEIRLLICIFVIVVIVVWICHFFVLILIVPSIILNFSIREQASEEILIVETLLDHI